MEWGFAGEEYGLPEHPAAENKHYRSTKTKPLRVFHGMPVAVSSSS